MNGWARAGSGKPWHQVEERSNGGVAYPCMGAFYWNPPSGVMDYRWTPPLQCKRPFCQQEVAP